jgi:hypothetical protein
MLEMNKSMSQEMFSKIDALNFKVKELLNKIHHTTLNIQIFGEKIEVIQHEFKQLLQECEDILNGV